MPKEILAMPSVSERRVSICPGMRGQMFEAQMAHIIWSHTVAGMHNTTPVMYTEEYQVDYYKENLKAFDEFPCVVGEQVWNFADFATSQSLLRVEGNKKGLFTRDRKPKLAAHWFRQRWHEIPDFGYKA